MKFAAHLHYKGVRVGFFYSLCISSSKLYLPYDGSWRNHNVTLPAIESEEIYGLYFMACGLYLIKKEVCSLVVLKDNKHRRYGDDFTSRSTSL